MNREITLIGFTKPAPIRIVRHNGRGKRNTAHIYSATTASTVRMLRALASLPRYTWSDGWLTRTTWKVG